MTTRILTRALTLALSSLLLWTLSWVLATAADGAASWTKVCTFYSSASFVAGAGGCLLALATGLELLAAGSGADEEDES